MNIWNKTVESIRRFNRLYTVHMGFLDTDYLDTEYSIAETRILFELKTNGTCIQSDIAKTLGIDKSYLSRIIKGFHNKDLIMKMVSDEDKRAAKISLTDKGNAETLKLIDLTNQQIERQIAGLSEAECKKLCEALNMVISILGKGNK